MLAFMSKQSITMPHDKAFKQALSDVRIARDFLKHYLPEKIKAIVNLDVLEIQDRTFIDKALQAAEADMLYRTQFNHDQAQEGYLYLLIEQQTGADRWLPLRLLKYLCSILECYRQQNPLAKQLPLVVPMIFYTGNAKPYSTNLFDLFAPFQDLAEKLFMGPYHQVNLKDIPDEEICKHSESGLMEMLMKHIKHRDALILIREAFETFLPYLLADDTHDNYVSAMLKYAIDQGEIQNVELFLLEIHQNLPKPLEEKVMTIAEQLIEKGLKRGIEQGIQQGMQQGELALLTRLIKRRFGNVPQFYQEKMQKADKASIMLWSENLLEANCLEEIFG